MSAAREFLLGAAQEYGWFIDQPLGRSFLYLETGDRSACVWFTESSRIERFNLQLKVDGNAQLVPFRSSRHKAAQVFFWMLDGSGTDEKGHRMSNPQPEVYPPEHTCDEFCQFCEERPSP